MSHNEDKEAAGRPKPVLPVMFNSTRATPTFSRSFKIKKDKPSPGGKADNLIKNSVTQMATPPAATPVHPVESSPEKKELVVVTEVDSAKSPRNTKIEPSDPIPGHKDEEDSVLPGLSEEVPESEPKVPEKVNSTAEKKRKTPAGKKAKEDERTMSRDDSGADEEDGDAGGLYEPAEGALGRPQLAIPEVTLPVSIIICPRYSVLWIRTFFSEYFANRSGFEKIFVSMWVQNCSPPKKISAHGF
jgi:hypothetical protein